MGSADVIIVGAGVMGASAAYHLASRGCSNVLVIERLPEPGLGSTGKATGGFRAQFGTEVNVGLSLLSRKKLLQFKGELGIDPGYRQCGYLFVANNQSQLDTLRTAKEIQRSAGLEEACEVSPSDIAGLNPAIRVDGILGGTYCPTDGFMRPMDVLRGYCEGAKGLGARFLYDVDVTGFDMASSHRIRGIRTTKGTFTADTFVNAAGAWAGELARFAGVKLPVEPVRRQVATLSKPPLLSEDMPMTIFVEDGFHLRVRVGKVLLLLGSDRYRAVPFDSSFEPAWLDDVVRRAHECVACLKEATVDLSECWAGLYEMSPDKHAILGRSTEVENFYLINGSSGHGVMHSPALGQLLAEEILDGRARSLDVHALRPSRFAEGKPNPLMEFL